MKVVYVRWRDAVAEEATEGGTGTASLVVLEEVGWLLHENDEAVLIGMEIHQDQSVAPGRWRLSIPRTNILEMYTIKTFKKARKG